MLLAVFGPFYEQEKKSGSGNEWKTKTERTFVRFIFYYTEAYFVLAVLRSTFFRLAMCRVTVAAADVCLHEIIFAKTIKNESDEFETIKFMIIARE